MIERIFAGLPAVGPKLRGLRRRALAALPGVRQIEGVLVAGVLAAAAAARLTMLLAVGLNSDEAVYSGQAAAIARDPVLADLFPVFRAHPLLFQFVLSLFFRISVNELAGRLLAALAGIVTVYLVYALTADLYGRAAGAVAAVFLALMPYHIAVTRQALLDGPMAMFSTLAAVFVARYCRTRKPMDLYAASASLGLTFLTKETGILLAASAYVFFSLSPGIGVRLRDVAVSGLILTGLASLFPASVLLAGSGTSATAQQYLVWQFFRFPNHSADFYLRTIPSEIGWLVIFLGLVGLLAFPRARSWRETLLAAWIVVPIVFFQLWPTKGYQYLLPIAPPVAALAGRALVGLFAPLRETGNADPGRPHFLLPLAFTVVAFSLLVPAYFVVFPQPVSESLAGSGGVPGGREAGLWVRDNLPEGATLMTIGPSMANILQFYGHRQALGLSVSANPLYRNPSYSPVDNPDLQIRLGEIQYLVWDAYSANRSDFFSSKLLAYVQKYDGRVAYSGTIPILTDSGATIAEPVIIIYRVYP